MENSLKSHSDTAKSKVACSWSRHQLCPKFASIPQIFEKFCNFQQFFPLGKIREHQ